MKIKKLTLTTILLLLVNMVSIAQSKIPSNAIKTIDGKQTNLQHLAKENNLLVVAFWATWCVPCKNELDAINDVYKDWQEETNVKLYAVSIDDSRTVKRVKPLVNGKGWEFDILFDTNNDLKRALGFATVPYIIIIKNGKIIYKHSGYTPGSEDDFYDVLKENS